MWSWTDGELLQDLLQSILVPNTLARPIQISACPHCNGSTFIGHRKQLCTDHEQNFSNSEWKPEHGHSEQVGDLAGGSSTGSAT